MTNPAPHSPEPDHPAEDSGEPTENPERASASAASPPSEVDDSEATHSPPDRPLKYDDDAIQRARELLNVLEGSVGHDTQDGDEHDSQDEVDPVLQLLEPPTRMDAIGTFDGYSVMNVIGRGAFGTVLRAYDEKLQRFVAIKVLSRELAATSPARKRFLREARAAAGIRHNNVVSIHGVGESPLPYLVMEYIPGQTLQQKLDGQGPLDILQILQIGTQIADGLTAAHDSGLVHRDVKPANILLESGVDEHVKITDFGLARTADDASQTRSGAIAGTPAYMSPEQAMAGHVDPRADLFSLGSVLYAMTTGRPPFRAPTIFGVLRRVAEDTPRPIHEIIPEAPDWLVELIAKLHAKEPDERVQSAREVAAILKQALQDHRAGRATVSTQFSPLHALAESSDPQKPSDPPMNVSTAAMRNNALAQQLRRRLRLLVAALGAAAALAALLILLRGRREDIPEPTGTIAVDASPKVIKPLSKANSVMRPEASTGNRGDREAAKWVLAWGGEVVLADADEHEQRLVQMPLPAGPFEVREVVVQGLDQSINNGLEILRECRALRTLRFRAVSLTDQGLAKLTGLPIRTLHVGPTQLLTSDAMAVVASFEKLEKLQLSSAIATDDGLAALKSLPGLTWVGLSHNQSAVTSNGIRRLGVACPRINMLIIQGAGVKELVPQDLAPYRNIQELHLTGLQLTDATVDAINGLPHLKSIAITHSVTDDALRRIGRLQHVSSLNLQSDDGAEWDRTKISPKIYSEIDWPASPFSLYIRGTRLAPSDADLFHMARQKSIVLLRLDCRQDGKRRYSDATIDEIRRLRPRMILTDRGAP